MDFPSQDGRSAHLARPGPNRTAPITNWAEQTGPNKLDQTGGINRTGSIGLDQSGWINRAGGTPRRRADGYAADNARYSEVTDGEVDDG